MIDLIKQFLGFTDKSLQEQLWIIQEQRRLLLEKQHQLTKEIEKQWPTAPVQGR